LACNRAPFSQTSIVPAFSHTNILPSGENSIAVGELSPLAAACSAKPGMSVAGTVRSSSRCTRSRARFETSAELRRVVLTMIAVLKATMTGNSVADRWMKAVLCHETGTNPPCQHIQCRRGVQEWEEK
jgi:hypothetical protein